MQRRDVLVSAAAMGLVAGCSYVSQASGGASRRDPIWDLGSRTVTADLVVYGSTPAGITAAISAAREGASAVIVGGWRDVHLGGMMSGGLGLTDVRDPEAYGGLSGQMLRRLGAAHPSAHPHNPFAFDPILAEAYFERERVRMGVPFIRSGGVSAVDRRDREIHALHTHDGITVKGRSFIDASYEGDLMALAGVRYHVGREAASARNPLGGYRPGAVRRDGVLVDPFITMGDATSGLLPGVAQYPGRKIGSGDRAVPAYCFRLTMTNRAGLRLDLPAAPPPGYEALRYEPLLRFIAGLEANGRQHGRDWTFNDTLIVADQVAPGIYDVNNRGYHSIDAPGLSWEYPEADYATRERIWKAHEAHIRGFFYTLAWGNDSRLPASLVREVRSWGLAKGHYAEPHPNDSAGWPYQLYVREARRMDNGLDWSGSDLAMPDGSVHRAPSIVAMASYMQDSHAVQRVALQDADGQWGLANEGGFGLEAGGEDMRAPLPFDLMVPHEDQCTNLLVSFCGGASHQAFSSMRMEPTAMVMGEAAGAAAALAVAGREAVNFPRLPYAPLKALLLSNGAVLDERSAFSSLAFSAQKKVRRFLHI